MEETDMAGANTEAAVPAQKMMGFAEAVKTCFKKFLSFRGCATRAEYWWFYLFCQCGSIILFVPLLVSAAKGWYAVTAVFGVLSALFSLAIIPPMISVGVRRMHDTGNWGFLLFIPIAGFINLFMPSLETSEYKDGWNIHPTANALGKAFVIFVYIFCIIYAAKVVFLSVSLFSIRNAGSFYETDDDEESDYDMYDDDDYADFPEELPPVSHEQLEKILDEIVMYEESIIARGESGEPVELETLAYIYAHGNTYLVSVNEDSPYYSWRFKNPNPENGTPNFIVVIYARPTRKNMRIFSYDKDNHAIELDERDLDYNGEEITELYKKINSWTITWRTSAKIAGDTYEVLFSDIDDDKDEN